jgi:hypothetical protein
MHLLNRTGPKRIDYKAWEQEYLLRPHGLVLNLLLLECAASAALLPIRSYCFRSALTLLQLFSASDLHMSGKERSTKWWRWVDEMGEGAATATCSVLVWETCDGELTNVGKGSLRGVRSGWRGEKILSGEKKVRWATFLWQIGGLAATGERGGEKDRQSFLAKSCGGRALRLWRANIFWWTKRRPNMVWRAKIWLGYLWPASKQLLIS